MALNITEIKAIQIGKALQDGVISSNQITTEILIKAITLIEANHEMYDTLCDAIESKKNFEDTNEYYRKIYSNILK